MCTPPPIFKHGKSKTSSTFHHVVCLSNKATRLRIAGPDDVPGRFASLTRYNQHSRYTVMLLIIGLDQSS